MILGFRVKSGWAATVLVAGPAQCPRLIAKRPIDLCDPEVPESRQPYHAGMGQLETNTAQLQKRQTIIRKAVAKSVPALIDEYRQVGGRISAAAIVVGSDIDPAAIANPHIRAHALEGRLFQTVLEDALGSCGLRCTVIVERNLLAGALARLKRSEADLKKQLSEIGRALPGPWRADDKAAALAAWQMLGSTARQKMER